ncbi:MAG: pyridoxamine 5'-phosphate oxidase family protein [Actinobacteria bacterium]|nr:pyridoxamine 5'-phosphate oxidase family protein [Actinomycetota bacterium]
MTRDEFVEFVRSARLGVVATVSAEGHAEAALVELAVTGDGEVVFDTKTGARKVANIAGNPSVALVVGWDSGVSVQVEGQAEVLSGAEREKYGRVYLEQFPGARALLDEFALIRVIPRWLRLYDARPESFQIMEGPLA